MNIQNKVVLVTGASRGIGMAIATEISDKGAIVIGTATSVDGASNISKALSAQERKGEGMVLDVNSSVSITNLIKAINDKYGDIQILVMLMGVFLNQHIAFLLLVPVSEESGSTKQVFEHQFCS